VDFADGWKRLALDLALDDLPGSMEGSLVSERRQYKNPPIQEALVEFQFESSDWDMTIPGRLHQELASTYDGKPQQQRIALEASGAEGELNAVQPIGRVQLPDRDRTKLVTVSHNVVSAHVLYPYPGWDTFRVLVQQAFAAYVRVASPSAVRRIGLRYINKVTLPPDLADLGRYFTGVATQPSVAGIPRKHFVHRDEFLYDDEAQLLLTFAQLPKEPASLLLDLDLVWPQKVDLDRATDVVESLRERERVAFEQLITNDLREIFDNA
jgi:uncharacterized protein (TIGR04255 family)